MNNTLPDSHVIAVQQALTIDQSHAVPLPAATTSGAHRKRTWLTVLVALGLALCVGLGVFFAALISRSVSEQPKVAAVLDVFMTAMAKRDTETAYSLFPTRAQNQSLLADLNRMVQGNGFCLFEGYRDLTITAFVINVTYNNDPDIPQGPSARVQGTVSYEGSFTGTLSAILEPQGDEWRLVRINVVVPPDKFMR